MSTFSCRVGARVPRVLYNFTIGTGCCQKPESPYLEHDGQPAPSGMDNGFITKCKWDQGMRKNIVRRHTSDFWRCSERRIQVVQYSERATLQQLSTKYCALHFKHLTVANMSDVRSKRWRGQRRRGVRLAGAVSQSPPSLCLAVTSVTTAAMGPGWSVILLKTELFSYLTIHKQGDI